MCNYFEKDGSDKSGMSFKTIVGHTVFIAVEITVLYFLFC